jgi:hypothetical protein
MALLVIFALATCADGRATLNRDPPNAARVAGHVRVGGEGTVVRGARVTLLPTLEIFQPDMTPPCVETDRDGRYAFEGIAPGAYLVAASKTGFPRTAVVPVHLSAGRAIDSVDVFLERGGVITGRISDENGEPLIGVVVEALNTVDQHGAMLRDFVRAGHSGTTDDRGEFRVFGLPPGMYVVEAAIGCPPRCIETHGVATGARYSYYAGVTDRSEARVIPVTAGQVVTGIDFTVALHSGFESRPDVVWSDKTSSRRKDMFVNDTAGFMLGRTFTCRISTGRRRCSARRSYRPS